MDRLLHRVKPHTSLKLSARELSILFAIRSTEITSQGKHVVLVLFVVAAAIVWCCVGVRAPFRCTGACLYLFHRFFQIDRNTTARWLGSTECSRGHWSLIVRADIHLLWYCGKSIIQLT